MRNLPSEYQEVEYIESSGSGATGQFIRTGFKANQNTAVEMSVSASNTTGNACFYCSRTGGVTATFTCFRIGNKLRHDYNTTQQADVYTISANTIYKIYANKNLFYVNDSLVDTRTAGTFQSSYAMLLLASNNGGDSVSIDNCLSGKLYYCKIWDNGTLVRDFVPCYRKSDNEIGLYDLVNDQFYTNSGTGTFTKGSDVKGAKIQRIYVGSNLVRPSQITKTYTLTNGASLYMTGWKPKSIIYECDYYNPSSGWTGATIKIAGASSNIGWYIWGGQNISSYPNSDGKIESVGTKIYDSVHKYISKGTTNHLKVTFTREGISLKVGSNAEETYLYSSGSWGPTALSIMDSSNLVAGYSAGSGVTLSNGVATVTYSKA